MESVRPSASSVQEIEESAIRKREVEILIREANVARREAALLERKSQAAREEIERMQMTDTNMSDVQSPDMSRSNTVRQLSVNNIFNLLHNFDDRHETFKTSENQVRLLKNTCNLSDEETIVMLTEKVKGKAQRWFHSNADNLHLSTQDLLESVGKMYGRETDCPVQIKQFEETIWKPDESIPRLLLRKTNLANQVSNCAIRL
ncbi:hypothetical protein KM043_016075 [Ampulex compressa]|nr:hypothetical protein KM043_016075 [Ampulex compressa]